MYYSVVRKFRTTETLMFDIIPRLFQLFGNSEQFENNQEAAQLLHDLQQLLEQ